MPILENKKHEAFANCCAKGETATASYAKAYKCKPDKSAGTRGSRLLENDGIVARMLELQQPSQQSREAGTIAELAEIQEFLTSAMRGELDSSDEESASLRDRLRASELLGKFSGLLRDKPDVSVTVAIITQEQAAARVKRVLPYVERVSLRQVNP